MYHCHIRFYLSGRQNRVFEIIKGAFPLENFTHEFSESEKPVEDLAAKADVIIANLQEIAGLESELEHFIGQREHGVEHFAGEPLLFHADWPPSYSESRFLLRRFCTLSQMGHSE